MPATPSRFSAFSVPLHYWLPCAVLALLLALFPQIDLFVSRQAYTQGQGFLYGHHPLVSALDPVTNFASALFVAAVAGWWLLGQVARGLPKVAGRFAAFVVLVFLCGPLIPVSLGLKQHWGRERPHMVTEFGGERVFTPYYLPTGTCEDDCSFSSGHTARGFYFLALAIYAYGQGWPRRRFVLSGALAFGLLAGGLRILEGKHYISDVAFSAFIVTYAAWVVYGLLYGRNPAGEPIKPQS